MIMILNYCNLFTLFFFQNVFAETRYTSTLNSNLKAKADIMTYHGGSVLTGDVNLYVVYYGDWKDSSIKIVNGFFTSIIDSDYYNVQRSYFFGGQGGKLILQKFIKDEYSQGKDIIPSSIIDSYIGNGQFPSDDLSNVYITLTYKDVNVNGFCSNFCGFHTNGRQNIFVGDPSRCGGACGGDPGINGDFSGDGIINILSHELMETISDPQLDAWYGTNIGAENGDLCNWQFGNVKYENGMQWNIETKNGNKYLAQMNFDVDTQQCLNGKPTTISTSTSISTSTTTNLSTSTSLSTTTNLSTNIPITTTTSLSISTSLSTNIPITTTTIINSPSPDPIKRKCIKRL